jgi:Uma2 family endonuclease
MSTHPKTFLTEEEYLEIERRAEYKSEYFQGEMFAMAGALAVHSLLVANILGIFYVQLAPRGCRRYSSDMRVRVSNAGLYTYPDAVVLCDEPRFLDDRSDTLLNPALIVEVLSASTEAYDRGQKFDYYKTIESLKEYLLISTDRIHADLYTRQADGKWLLTSADSEEAMLELQSVGCSLSLNELYTQIELAPASERHPGAPRRSV